MENRTRQEKFVSYVIERARADRGFAAAMRQADNAATEHRSWGILASFGIDLERDDERLPFALVGAALCFSGLEKDGASGMGDALAGAFETAEGSAEIRLRRLLACSSTREAVLVLRPILRLVNARTIRPLCHARLLGNLLFFNSSAQEKIKRRWAMEFYRNAGDKS